MKGGIWIIILLLFIIWALIERKLLSTTKTVIRSTKLPKKLEDTGFVVLADLHDCTFGKKNLRLMKQIELLKPDFIVLAGDIINKKKPCYPSNAYLLIEALAKKYKVYYAYGNHEQRLEWYGTKAKLTTEEKELYSAWVEFKRRLSSHSVQILNNQGLRFEKNGEQLQITGVTIGPEYFTRNREMDHRYLKSLIGKSEGRLYQILIAHNPDYFEEYADWGADLIISGHLHGGMVRIPGVGGILSPQAKFFPKYQSGTYSIKDKEMIVSRGLGSHSIMPRMFNIPELVYVQLKSK